MYNSLLAYALKNIKGNLIFSIALFLSLSQALTIIFIYTIVWRYEVLLNDTALFFKSMSIYSFFIYAVIMIIATSFISNLYIFSGSNRMFSTLRIFGARRNEILKLSVLQGVVYAVGGLKISIIEIIILYVRYREYIKSVINSNEIFECLKLFVFSNLIFIFIFIIVFVISGYLFLLKDPYKNMRSTL